MRLLVTGGAGFIGSAIVDAALGKGWQVRVLDSLDPLVHSQPPRTDPRVELIVGDSADPVVLREALAGIEAVSHQSAKVGLGVSFADAPDYVRNNDFATAVLLAAMEEAGTRKLVLASSMVVYGEGLYLDPASGRLMQPGPRRVPDLESGIFDPRNPETGALLIPAMVTEAARLDPRNVYAASKLCQEHLASSWARAVDGVAIALRYHNVYGPRMPKNTPYAGVASIFRSALDVGRNPEVYEDGGQTRDFVHVTDVARANVLALTAPEAVTGAYNVASGTPHTVFDLARALSASINPRLKPVVTGGWRLGDVRHVVASPARAAEALGFEAAVGFDAGMAEFAHAHAGLADGH